jgi:RNA polymerase sigma-70 factor, ECF subfamily
MRDDESSLVSQARRGNQEAFLELYSRHRTPVFRFAWRMTGSVDIAEDVTQECFLALVRGSGFDAGRGRLQTYLFGMARHLVFRHLRINEREAEEVADSAGPMDVLGGMLAAERSEMVRKAIASLPALQREAIVLFEYEELPLEAIAAIAGAEVGAVKARLSRARESLRRRLEPVLFRDAGSERSAHERRRSCS